MTYEKIFKMKFEEEIPTHELEKRFPKELKKISKIALMELPATMLRTLLGGESELEKLMCLKKNLLKKVTGEKKQLSKLV